MKTIVVIATICKESGALSIYRQLMYHLLSLKKNKNKYIVFTDPSMPKPIIGSVTYIDYCTSGINRILFDLYDFHRICKFKGIEPDVIFSLNNSGVRFPGIRQIIYYHQGLPLYNYHFSWTDKNDRKKALFTKFYPHYVKWSLKSNTSVVVQTETVKRLFVNRYRFPKEKIHVVFPDVARIDPATVGDYTFKENTINFVYPATAQGYKEHVTIAKALETISDNEAKKKIRIHLTINKDGRKDLEKAIRVGKLQDNFVFHGTMPYEQLLSMYKWADGLLFPSVIETIGLPLLEAAAFGLPVLASRLEYVKDVLEGYEGLMTVPLRDYSSWGKAIEKICIERTHYAPYHRYGGSDWPKVFSLIQGE